MIEYIGKPAMLEQLALSADPDIEAMKIKRFYDRTRFQAPAIKRLSNTGWPIKRRWRHVMFPDWSQARRYQ